MEEYKQQIKDAVLDEARFVRLTAKGPVRGAQAPWRRVVVRPVEIKRGRHLQFSYFDERQDTTKNARGAEASERLDQLLALPWASLAVETTAGAWQVQLTKKGRPIVHRSRSGGATIELRHDARKELPLPAERPDQFLIGLGIMNPQGAVNPSMADKFAQINEFLKLLVHTGMLDTIASRPIRILDAGCGSSYLSFAVYHYINHVRGIPAVLTGVDHNRKLIDKSNQLAAELGYHDIRFEAASIAGYQPEAAPDILLALHACDTATDDALALGIRQRASLILAVPCCHHHLHAQLGSTEPFGPVLQHGILRKRLADILTDTFRAQLLRLCGYRTDAVEFVSSEHTDRNLLLRAVRRDGEPDRRMIEEYEALKQFWSVTPYLETLLQREGLFLQPAATDSAQRA